MVGDVDRTDRLIRNDEVKRRVCLGKTLIYRLVQQERFPSPPKLSQFASR